MKLFIASDIHGSAYYCEKTIEAFKREKADEILLLGDILYHGPRNDLPRNYSPKKCIAMLNPLKDKITSVRGNCDAEVDQMVLDFPIMDDYKIFEFNNNIIFCTHGHIFGENNPYPIEKINVILHGHTHVPKCIEENGVLVLNPGSASIPKENSHHGYMTFQDGLFTWKDFDGNIIKEQKL